MSAPWSVFTLVEEFDILTASAAIMGISDPAERAAERATLVKLLETRFPPKPVAQFIPGPDCYVWVEVPAMIPRAALQAWCAEHGIYPPAFFPQGKPDPSKNKPPENPDPPQDATSVGRALRSIERPGIAAKNQQCAALVKEAARLWSGGDLRKHNEMAAHLEQKPEFVGLSHRQVLQKLVEYLRKSGRPHLIFGEQKTP